MPKKSTTKKEVAPKPKKDIKSENHWTKLRSHPKDVSKRIEPEKLKSLRTPRNRVNYNYNEKQMALSSLAGKSGKVIKKNAKASKNTLEQREQLAKIVGKKKSEVTVKTSRRGRKTSEDKKKKADKEKEKKKAAEASTEEEEEEEEEEQPKEEALSKKNMDIIKKLGGVPSKQNMKRMYRDKHNAPLAIRTLANIKWPKNKRFASETYDFGGLEMTLMDLEERNDFKFLRENELSAVIGSGDVVVATLLSDLSADFGVYLLDDNKKDEYEGPFKLSEFLGSLKEDTEDEMED